MTDSRSFCYTTVQERRWHATFRACLCYIAMKKGKQILAIIVVVFLVGLYLLTIVAALTASPNSSGLFAASIYATIVIPVLLWAYSLFYKILNKKNSNEALPKNESLKKSSSALTGSQIDHDAPDNNKEDPN